MFASKNPKIINAEINEKIIELALNAFQYQPHYHYDSTFEIDKERENILYNPAKSQVATATDKELSHLKLKIAHSFLKKIDGLKNQENLSPGELVQKIKEIITQHYNQSLNIRNYSNQVYIEERTDYVHGYTTESIPAHYTTITSLSHPDSRLEKNLNAALKALNNIPFDYKTDDLVFDVKKQITKIEQTGKNKQGQWKDPRYQQKMVVLQALLVYLEGGDIHTLSTIVNSKSNADYDKGGLLRSETGKLLDRALELKGEKLDPSNTLQMKPTK